MATFGASAAVVYLALGVALVVCVGFARAMFRG
jgi:hypothetical protein